MERDITAIICTHNGAAYLGRAFQSLIDQTLPRDRYDIIVVDNASTDGTSSLIECHARQYDNLRYVYEPQLGLSYARNRGVQEAQTPFAAFLDDDAAADEQWLESLLQRLDEAGADAVGGPSRLVWEAGPPDWLPRSYWTYFSYLDMGPEARSIRFPECPFGVNMAFNKSSLLKVGGFPVCLGRSGQNLTSGEETAVFWMMDRAGMSIWYEPRASVAHFVSGSRANRGYLIRRQEFQGFSQAIFQIHIQKQRKFYMFYRLSRSLAGLLFLDIPRNLIVSDATGGLEARATMASRVGYIRGIVQAMWAGRRSQSMQ